MISINMSACSPKSSILSYGAFVEGNQTTFKIHAPRSTEVYLVIFKKPEDELGKEYPMVKNDFGDWTITRSDVDFGTLYGYRLSGPVNDPNIIIADPYSKATVTNNSHQHIAKSLIINEDYDWNGDQWVSIAPEDLIIYEMHIRDMTAHHSSEAYQKGTYLGLTDETQRGGIPHLIEMGINAVQIMPLQDFANVEVPFQDKNQSINNDWNPYAINHWGYMTSFFFAPESYYATDGTNKPLSWNGTDGRAVHELKDMVKAFHNENIAVIMDVVYNHVSQYDYNPLKYIDRDLYFRFDEKGNWSAKSGCGNDCKTESPVMRNLILESLKYWMTEYHVDGFRFDLGQLIDANTRDLIISELRTINPNVIILAEPWGGGYNPHGFSDQGWASFNDQFRDGLKGSVFDINDKGFLFGKLRKGDDQKFLRRLATGSLREHGGQYISSDHSVNYLESHDDLTFGDRLRITGGFNEKHEIINDPISHAKVDGDLLAMNKLGALYLFTSQGIVFMHQGQEWARSKVIANTDAPDEFEGQIDHNSYEKDNETNWLNWNEKGLNSDLVDYYKGLIQLRKKYPSLRKSNPEDFKFFDFGKQIAVGYIVKEKMAIIMNGSKTDNVSTTLPIGNWRMIVDGDSVQLDSHKIMSGEINIAPISGMVLVRN
jgi:pullulanase/glycogen debranching enzyme